MTRRYNSYKHYIQANGIHDSMDAWKEYNRLYNTTYAANPALTMFEAERSYLYRFVIQW